MGMSEGSKRARGEPRQGARLGRAEKVRRSRCFQHIQRRGRRRVGDLVIVITRRGRQPWTRLGLTVSRKVGGAPTRNRVKRRLREIFRRHKTAFPEQQDVVIIARRAAATATFQALEAQVLRLIQPPRRRPKPPSGPPD